MEQPLALVCIPPPGNVELPVYVDPTLVPRTISTGMEAVFRIFQFSITDGGRSSTQIVCPEANFCVPMGTTDLVIEGRWISPIRQPWPLKGYAISSRP